MSKVVDVLAALVVMMFTIISYFTWVEHHPGSAASLWPLLTFSILGAVPTARLMLLAGGDAQGRTP